MSFYDPENFTDPVLIAAEQKRRVLQPVWNAVLRIDENVLRNPMFGGCLGLFAYFGLVAIFTIADVYGKHWNWLQKYKIQKQHSVTWALIAPSMALHSWNLILYILPLNFASAIWAPPSPVPPVAPELWPFIWHQAASWLLFDFAYWAYHVVHHKVRFLYRWCHSVHHQYHVPFAAMSQYLHPSELLYIGITVTVIPWLFKPHIMTYWSWILLTVVTSIEDHCGYDFPLMPHRFLSFYGGAPKHDMHHARPMSNFEPFFNHLDRLFGWELTREEMLSQKRNKSAVGLHNPEDDSGIEKFN